MSNLLQKASIITTPTAYNDGKLLSVKPLDYYGPELITNGDFATDSNWTKGAGTTISGDNANFVNANGVSLYQNIGTQSGFVKVVFSVTNYTSGTLNVYSGGNQSVGVVNVSANALGTYEVDVIRTGGNNNIIFGSPNNFTGSIDNVSVKEVLNADFDFTRGSSATRVGSNGLIQTVASGLPRIDYSGGVGHILTEPERTNQVTYSEDFSNSYWLKSGSGTLISFNTTTAPNGLQSASTLTQAGEGYIGFIKTTNLTETFSFFVKYSNSPWLFIEGYDGADKGAWFNIQTGNIGSTSGGATANIEEAANGFYRCSITATFSGATTFALFQTISNDSFTRANGDVIIWGAQLEVGSFPTSYIVSNSGNPTTRLAETLNNSGSADLINSTEGVLYAEIVGFVNGGNGDRTISISDGSTQNAIQLLLHNTANRINFRSRSGGSLDVNISDFTFQQNQTNKIACKFKSGDYALWVNGVERVTSTSSSLPTGLSVLAFDDGSSNDFYGKTKSVAVFKDALSDLELECLSSWMSFADMGIALGYTIE